jgi:hypothetical protein
MGRDRVRATLPSKSRSTMSLKVHPAPRMTMAPMRNSVSRRTSGTPPPAATWASAIDHQPGSSKSHQPIGRSKRASRA